MPQVALHLILILGAMSAFGPLATDMYLPAFPVLGAGLGADAGQVQRTLAAFFAGMAMAQMVYGPLADRFGRKPPTLAGLAIFTIASLGCATTQDIGWFTFWRFVQGLGGCAGMVMARAIVRDLTEGPGSVRLMSQLMLVSGIAPILAPSIGGGLLAIGPWRLIFWVLAAYSAGLALVVRLFLPESLAEERRRRDGPLGILQVYLRLLGNRHFLGHALSGALPAAGMFAYIGGSPFVFMELHGVAPSTYGLFFGLNAFGIMLMAQTSARLAKRVAASTALTAALCWMSAAGALLVLVAATGAGGFPAIAVLLFCYVAGIGATMPLGSALAMGPQGRVAGSASALIGTLQFGLGAVSGWMVGALHNDTAVPMALGVALCGLGGLLAKTLLAR
ncbi:multidrug effflux MFS transporter [Siccirubricoccus sp. KC 17139]|uniref:Bcr/CflA family efflux transporter n=1 Tax=Siccirubricoccus soli TaxID=2899147 RepID=A0ABT1D0J9_9PROT|nr:multidrug effflux MFS transporter [Siccirubricoccus soli]MCO6415451.1 multidrug effflux MFS transporter [Siccirubricoccus soli]MCP2681583.1 multidrug effflux MFS transporter [Siccirubricoccus soli]